MTMWGLLLLALIIYNAIGKIQSANDARIKGERDAAVAADDIRARTQATRTQHDASTPRTTDDELDDRIARLRAATAAARKNH